MNLARTTVIPVLTVKLIIIKYLQWSESVCRRGHGTSDSTPQRRFEVSPADLQIPWSFQAFFVPFCTQWVQNCCSSRHINTDSGPRWQLAATRVNQRTGQYHYSRMSKYQMILHITAICMAHHAILCTLTAISGFPHISGLILDARNITHVYIHLQRRVILTLRCHWWAISRNFALSETKTADIYCTLWPFAPGFLLRHIWSQFLHACNYFQFFNSTSGW